MKEYPKIKTVYLRDPETKFKTLLDGQFALEEFKYLKDNEWIFTEKVDGTNIRVQYSGSVYFRGKSDNAQIPAFLVDKLRILFTEEKLKPVFPDVGNTEPAVCLYGEGYGAKIQKGGGNYGQDQNFVLFDVKIDEWWLQRKDIKDIAAKLGIDVVPIVGTGNLENMVEMAREGFKSHWGDFLAEGIVARPKIELKRRSGERIITKIKYKDFTTNLRRSR